MPDIARPTLVLEGEKPNGTARILHTVLGEKLDEAPWKAKPVQALSNRTVRLLITDRDDAKAHDALLCIGMGKSIKDEARMKFACDEFYLKSSDEMARLFRDIPESLAEPCRR